MRKRADILLVERGVFATRASAQAAIAAGLVRADGRPVCKASQAIEAGAALEAEAPHPYVSRGGLKLAGALDAFGLDPAGLACLDVGASTGGFTDVLLKRGARRVVAADVGHGQLSPALAADPRVVSLEGRDARFLTAADVGEPPQGISCDVSFISQRLVLPHILKLAAPGAWLASLIKPQFEAGRGALVKGRVSDDATLAASCAAVAAAIEAQSWAILGLIPSPIEGGDGQREYLIAARAP